MTQTIPYITFPGNTREAMEFYKQCLGGEVQIMLVEGSPMEDQMPPEMKNSVLHSELTNGSIRLMASDLSGPKGVTYGNNISITLDCATEEEIHRYYGKLSEGGSADYPVHNAFWGGLFGQLTDKYGLVWLLNCSAGGQG